MYSGVSQRLCRGGRGLAKTEVYSMTMGHAGAIWWVKQWENQYSHSIKVLHSSTLESWFESTASLSSYQIFLPALQFFQ